MANQVFNVRLTLSDNQVKNLVSKINQPDMTAVESAAQVATARVADGGSVIPFPVVRRIEKVLGVIGDPMEIARAVEASVGMDGDNVVVSMTIDPVYVGELREKAAMNGMTINSLASEMLSQLLHQGLLYDMQTETVPVFFTPQQLAFLRKHFNLKDGEPLFGDTMAKKIGWKTAETAEMVEA